MRDMSRFTRINGSIAIVVVFLVWVYMQAVILLYGVEFTAAYARLRRGRPDDAPATPALGDGERVFNRGRATIAGRSENVSS